MQALKKTWGIPVSQYAPRLPASATRRQEVSLSAKRGDRVVLRQPVAVEAQPFRRLPEADRLVDGLCRRMAADDGRLIENA